MRIEAFSEGKVFARPQDNEDAFLVLPGMGYAVVDGVTDYADRGDDSDDDWGNDDDDDGNWDDDDDSDDDDDGDD